MTIGKQEKHVDPWNFKSNNSAFNSGSSNRSCINNESTFSSVDPWLDSKYPSTMTDTSLGANRIFCSRIKWCADFGDVDEIGDLSSRKVKDQPAVDFNFDGGLGHGAKK